MTTTTSMMIVVLEWNEIYSFIRSGSCGFDSLRALRFNFPLLFTFSFSSFLLCLLIIHRRLDLRILQSQLVTETVVYVFTWTLSLLALLLDFYFFCYLLVSNCNKESSFVSIRWNGKKILGRVSVSRKLIKFQISLHYSVEQISI